jgi:adenosylmethionine-8-amino-7-oxononanoate aminotransferase
LYTVAHPTRQDGTAALGESRWQELAKRHLWMHFTRHGALDKVPVIVRGEGCYVFDEDGRRYLDGLAALFCVNAGHGRADIADAASAQARELSFYTTWSFAHPPAIELAARVAELAPGDLNRVFFTSGGSEAVDSALKLCRQYHKLNGEPGRYKAISRKWAYHGTTFGALSLTGIPVLRSPFEPLFPGSAHVPNTNVYRLPPGMTAGDLAESIRERIIFEGPETVSCVFLEPVQNSGGCLVPPEGYFQRVREICDEFGVILVSDEVICSWGRLGAYFGADRLGFEPDLITTAKGITSAYAPMGAVIASDRIAAPFLKGNASFTHGITFGGHPVAAAVALATLDAYEREGMIEHVRAHEGEFQAMLESLRDIPIVGDVRGMGYFWAIELVRDQDTKEPFSDADEREWLLRGFLGPELFKRGLICRADDRGDAVLQFSPPLIAGPEQFAEMEAALRPTLEEAARRCCRSAS